MRSILLHQNHYYHVFNRGVEKRVLFNDRNDYQRFYESLFLFNDSEHYSIRGTNTFRTEEIKKALTKLSERLPLVEILAYCLMPTHFHLLLKQKMEAGISKFLHRLCVGYANYFNIRYERTGRLFESTFKAVAVERDGHFRLLPNTFT